MNVFTDFKDGNVLMTAKGRIIIYDPFKTFGIEEVQEPEYRKEDLLPVALTVKRMNQMGYMYDQEKNLWEYEDKGNGAALISGRDVILTGKPKLHSFYSVHEVQNWHLEVTGEKIILKELL